MTEKQALDLMTRCPRFDRCGAPQCPLDVIERSPRFPGEARCSLSKNRRMALAEGTGHPRQGLTRREWKGRQAWEALAPEKKAAALRRLQTFPPPKKHRHQEERKQAL